MTSAGLPPHDGQHPSQSPPAGPPASVRRKRWISLAVIGLGAAAGAAYPIYRDAHPAADTTPASATEAAGATQAASAACTVPGADSITLAKKDAGEPALHIPLTAGWQQLDYTTDPRYSSMLAGNPQKAAVIRGVVANRADGSTPSIEVDLIPFRPQDMGKSDKEIAQLILPGAVEGGVVDSGSTDTVCGATVYRANYSRQPNPDGNDVSGTVLVGFPTGDNGTRWAAVANLTTTDPTNPAYIAQRDALAKGFHATAP